MKKVIGLILFCVGAGMSLMLLLPHTITVLFFIAAFILIGYNLFCS